jgi:hypothetical protein
MPPMTDPSYAMSRSPRGRLARHAHVEEDRAALASLGEDLRDLGILHAG